MNTKDNIIDSQGFLININYWNKDIALKIAKNEGITLTNVHWDIIYFMRSFYMQYKISPNIRILIQAMQKKYGNTYINSTLLFHLFSKKSAAQLAAKIAGLPKPSKCL